MKLSGWGCFPVVDSNVSCPRDYEQMASLLQKNHPVITRGMGRSYGDSSIASQVLQTKYLDNYLDFDAATGVLHCEAGVVLDDIIRTFMPRGWFLPVTPGTRFVSVGGAIASDVHGKNHHLHGSFSDHVDAIELMPGNGEIVTVSRRQLPDLWHATCGGMGLTGIICSAHIRLKAVATSTIEETIIKAPNLETVLAAIDTHHASSYSVAWIDCMARGSNMGRGLLLLGEHQETGEMSVNMKQPRTLPPPPSMLLNSYSARAFNWLYHGKAPGIKHTRVVDFTSFFYPLDSIANWNRFYGNSGFVQYQCVLPAAEHLERLLQHISSSGQGAFLAVLKKFGPGNNNILSFPMAGYTLAVDFKRSKKVMRLLQQLDELVLQAGGRIYLAKDACMHDETFRACYPRWQEFEQTRERYHALGKFSSAQSRRLGLQ